MRCPNCGEMNEPEARFCFNCGTELAQATTPEPPEAVPTTPAPAPPLQTTPPAFDPTIPVWPPLQESASTPPPTKASSRPGEGFDFPPPPAAPTTPAPLFEQPKTAEQAAPPPPPPQFVPPPPLNRQSSTLPPQYPDWRMGGMSSVEEDVAPPRRGRNRFLMIILGILLGCLILCVGLFIFSITPTGQDFFEDVGTSIADIATESADDT